MLQVFQVRWRENPVQIAALKASYSVLLVQHQRCVALAAEKCEESGRSPSLFAMPIVLERGIPNLRKPAITRKGWVFGRLLLLVLSIKFLHSIQA